MDSLALIIFGITSNLVQIKLIPALYNMAEKGLLPRRFSIIGVSRKAWSREDLKRYFFTVLNQPKKEVFAVLAEKLHFVSGSIDDPKLYQNLKDRLDSDNRIFYLATYPELYPDVLKGLKRAYLNQESRGFTRLMIEKPIGNDLRSARALNRLLAKFFKEEQIYRIDHYLGKETIQNILAFRFRNDIFEPLINHRFIDHIQITSAEDFGVGERANYYDKVGALKDVGQNHLLQMLALATMDQPAEFSNQAITRQRLKLLRRLMPLPEQTVFGQYRDYKFETNVAHGSQTETFFALKTHIDNDRFKNVPIYIRAGKKLAQTVTEISLVFKNEADRGFRGDQPNILIYRIQPNEGIVLRIITKKPGYKLELQGEYMQFCYRLGSKGHLMPNPYEQLIADAISGDQTFFNDAKEIEAQWAFIDPIAAQKGKPYLYQANSWGPKQADALLQADGRSWLEPSMDFCRF